jgi:hypothetical protein
VLSSEIQPRYREFKSFCSCNFLRTFLLPQVSAFLLALCFLTLKNYFLFPA